MDLYHAFHLPHFHLARTGPLLAHAAIRRLAISMVGIFSPVYVYQVFVKSGYASSRAIAAALGFWAVMFLVKAVAIVFGLERASRWSLRWVLLAAGLTLLLFLTVLPLVRTQPFLLVLSGGLWGLGAGFFWAGFHSFFVHLGDGDHFGKEVGCGHVLDLSASIVGPLLGGVIVQLIGFSWLFGVAFVIAVVSLLPLVRIDHRQRIRPFSLGQIGQLLKDQPRAVIAYAGSAGSTALNISIWPVFVFLLLGSYLRLGVIAAAAVLIAGVVTLGVGWLTDRQGKVRWIQVGTLGEGVAWLVRIFVRSVPAVVAADSLYRVFERVMYVPLDALTYQKAQDGGVGKAVMFREVTQALAAVWVLILGAVLVVLGVPLTTLFAVGAFCSIGPLWLRRSDRPKK